MTARISYEQIISMIKEQEAGEKSADVCRRQGSLDRQGIAQKCLRGGSAAFSKYKSKYGGMEPSDAKRLRALEDENGKLKTLSAEQMLVRDHVRYWSEENGRALCCVHQFKKNCDARGKAECGGSPLRSARCEPAAGV